MSPFPGSILSLLAHVRPCVIKPAGYLFTYFYLTGVFFPRSTTGIWAQLTFISGHLAFSIFALLVARGAHRTANHFLYFVRLLLAAIAVEVVSFFATRHLAIYFGQRNALFTYAASLSLIAGISMAIGCYHDMVSQAVPADGGWNKKGLFGVPVNPGNYKMAPIPGMVLGLLTAGLSIFVTVYFDFSEGLFGLLFIVLMFLALRDEATPKHHKLRQTIYRGKKEYQRALIYSAALAFMFILVSLITKRFDMSRLYVYFAPVAATLLLGVLLERKRAPGKYLQYLSYAMLPLSIGLFCLIACLV